MPPAIIDDGARGDRIRYAQCWEDADVMLDALAVQPGDVCLSIASAGDNTLALLARHPARVIAIDLSGAQLHCLALRVAAYRRLQHAELLELIGSRPSTRRRALFEQLRPALTQKTAAFWNARWPEVERRGVGGVGRLEAYFRIFRRWVLPWVHGRATIEALLQPKCRALRGRFYAERWHTTAWRLLLKSFFCPAVMARLGREPAFFRYVEGDLAAHVECTLAHALTELEPADNPYLAWILTGRHGDALPFALRAENFDAIRANLDRLELRRQSLAEFAAGGEPVDACNLSDVFEYMSPAEHEMNYGRLLDCARPGARFAYWNMMVPRTAPAAYRARVASLDDAATSLRWRARTFFYSRFVLEVVR